MTNCPDPLSLEAYVDGELLDDELTNLERHLSTCALCQREVEELRSLNALLHDAEIGIVASETLTSRLRQATPRKEARLAPTRRHALFGGLAAAAAGVVLIPPALRDQPLLLAPALIGDFEARVDAGRPLDVYISDFAGLQDWTRDKTEMSPPDLSQLAGIDLSGGRLCWLLERRFIAMDFIFGPDRYTLYIGSSENLRVSDQDALPNAQSSLIPLVTRGGVTAGFWQNESTAYALVGQPTQDTILSLAKAIRREVGIGST